MKTARARATASMGSGVLSNSSSAHTKVRSPARTAALHPNQSGSPIRCWRTWAAASAVWALARPRRVADRSITSSWSSANVWSSSMAAAGRSTASSCAAPVARWPQYTKAGRSRLPPAATSERISPVISPSTGSSATVSAVLSARNRSSVVRSGPWTTAKAPPPPFDAVPTGVLAVVPSGRSRSGSASSASRPASHACGSRPRSSSCRTCSTDHGLSDEGSRSTRWTTSVHGSHRRSSTSSGSGVAAPATSAMTTGHSSCSTVPSGISAR